jgi:hypothetical protein
MSISEHTFGDPYPGTGGDAGKAAARLLEKTAQETDQWRAEAYRVREETAAVRKRSEEDVAHLQQVASDHRDRLRQHLSELLDRVETVPGAGEQ